MEYDKVKTKSKKQKKMVLIAITYFLCFCIEQVLQDR